MIGDGGVIGGIRMVGDVESRIIASSDTHMVEFRDTEVDGIRLHRFLVAHPEYALHPFEKVYGPRVHKTGEPYPRGQEEG